MQNLKAMSVVSEGHWVFQLKVLTVWTGAGPEADGSGGGCYQGSAEGLQGWTCPGQGQEIGHPHADKKSAAGVLQKV